MKKNIIFTFIFLILCANYAVLAQKDTKLTYRNEEGEALEYIYVISYDEGKYAYESQKVKKTPLKVQKHAYPNTQVLLNNEVYTIKAGTEIGLSFKNKAGKEKIFAQEYLFEADDKSGDCIVEMGIGIFGYISGKKGAKLQRMETLEGSAYKNIWQVKFPKRNDIFTISYEKSNKVIKCTNKAGKSQSFLMKK